MHTMNLESHDYIDQLINLYFATNSKGAWSDCDKDLMSMSCLAEIFNQYIDYAHNSNNFKKLESIKEDKEFLLALSHNLLFILNVMKNNNITYKNLFNDYIKHKKHEPDIERHPTWIAP